MSEDRLTVLDGLRGVAILMVVGYHYFAAGEATADSYPYGNALLDAPVLSTGFVGVYLFFIISGFVILRSLKSSETFPQFAAKRGNRLVLPMLVLSSLTFVMLAGPLATTLVPVHWSSFVPSWTFTAPELWRWLLPEAGYIDGAYWTLYAEVRFYLIMALIWFCLPKRWVSTVLAAHAIGGMAAYAIVNHLDAEPAKTVLYHLLMPNWIALFASGAVYSELMDKTSGDHVWRWVMLAGLIPASLVGAALPFRDQFLLVALWCAAFHGVFILVVLRVRMVEIFAWRPLVFLGMISYSLYLVHQNLGLAIISRIPQGWHILPQVLAVIGVAGVAVAVAFLSWRYLERQKPFRAA